MCMFDAGYSEGPLFYRTKMVTARKPHKCSECQGPIRVGQRYEYTSARWPDIDGICCYSTCTTCINGMRQWLVNTCDGWLFSSVMEDAIEHAEEPEEHGLSESDLDSLHAALVCTWTPEAVAA